MMILSLLPFVFLPVMADQEMDRSQVRKTIICGIQYNHATSACVLIVANENDFTVGSVSVQVELGNPDGVIERKTITIKRIKGNRFHLSRFKPKRDLGPVAIVEAKAFSAKVLKKKRSKKRPKQSKGLKKDLKQARLRISELEAVLTEAEESQESSRTKAREQCNATARRRFLLYFKELDKVFREQEASDDQMVRFYEIAESAAKLFKGNRVGRADFVDEAERWMQSKMRMLKNKAEVDQKVLDALIRSHAKTIPDLLSGKDDASSAKIKAAILGRRVSWTGTVTEVMKGTWLDQYELELICVGVKVEVVMIHKGGQLPGLGQDVRVDGIIEDIRSYGMFGCTIRLSQCRIKGI